MGSYSENNEQQVDLVTRIVTGLIDFSSSLALFIYVILVGPLLMLKIPFTMGKVYRYFLVLLPRGGVMHCLKAMVDWRLGNFNAAISQIENVLSLLGIGVINNNNYRNKLKRVVVEDLLTILSRCYLHMGRIDEAMQVVLRAKKILGIQRLPSLPDLDIKTVQLVRAGLAAGRLLEGDGAASLFVKSGAEPRTQNLESKENPKQKNNKKNNPWLNGSPPRNILGSIISTHASLSPNKTDDEQAKIIPFPIQPRPQN